MNAPRVEVGGEGNGNHWVSFSGVFLSCVIVA
jgi:hypothetical protein